MKDEKTIYELINPSDKVTFLASTDKVAFVCAVLVGRGAYSAKNAKTSESVGGLLFFMDEEQVGKELNKKLGTGISDFIDKNKQHISEALQSFSYISASERGVYDSALAAITGEEYKKQFLAQHEDQNRSSMNQIVKNAWSIADQLVTVKQE